MAAPGPGEATATAAEEERYRGLVTGAKAAAADGDLEEALRLFQLAAAIRPSEKLRGRMQRVQEALAAAEQEQLEEAEEGFVNVCDSGLLIYGEMHGKLFQHQREGVAFLYRLHRDGKPGGILADDMGLGKTIQVIAFLSGMFDAELIQHVLLIMPTTLVNSWLAEFARWTPGLRVKEFHGTSKTERTRNLERVQRKNGIIITSYQMLINNWKQLASCHEQEFVWDYVILDEAHKIKCPSNKTTKCVYAIPAQHRVLLTGTPVQNNLREMWSLFDFACQGSLLGTAKTFKMEYENPITRAREKDATPGEKALGLKISENLMAIIKPYFLRRTKEDIKSYHADKVDAPLPEDPTENKAPVMPSLTRKNDFVVWVYLAPVQEEIYRNFLCLDHVKEVLMTTRSPLAELTVLKKLCDHPRLLSARACIQLGLDEQEGFEQDYRMEVGVLSGMNKIDHLSDETVIQESGKMQFLVGLLERLREEGHRTLVFSQSRKMLDIIELVLSRRQFQVLRIDGTVTHLTERERRINAFQSNTDYSVFLLTTQVGGVGITLTAASRVVIFDPSWNPATDAQAVDRAYRIGQKENVVIYRLITCGTVEEKIYRRQVFKDSLIRQTTGDKKNPFRYFSKQELRELFTLEDTRTSATQIQLQSLHAMQRKSDLQLDEHLAYLHSLAMFGISDHDLIYTKELAHEEQVESEEAQQYIQRRVQKAHELVQLESQLRDQRMEGIRNACEEKWQKPSGSVSGPKKLSPGLNGNNHFVSPPVADAHEKDKVIDLTEDEEAQVLDLSSKMTAMTVGDLDERQWVQDVSSMETEVLNTSKTAEQSDIQEPEQNPESSITPSSPALKKGSQSLQEKQHFQVHSDSLAEARNDLSGHCHNSPESGMADDPRRDAELSVRVLDPHTALGTEQNYVAEPASASALLSLSNVTPEINAELYKSHMLEDSLEGTSAPSFQDQVDFNLVLEESEEGWQDASNGDGSVEHSEKESLQLQAESLCKSPEREPPNKTWPSETSSHGKPCPTAEEEPNASLQESKALEESSGVFTFVRKKCLNRIASDNESEEQPEQAPSSPLDSPQHGLPEGISASTPKYDTRRAKAIFSPQLSNSGNRSNASRRSFISKLVDEVEDIGEIMGTTDEDYDDDDDDDDDDGDVEQDGLVEDEAEECTGESAESEEGPTGETLDTSEESAHTDSVESEQSEAEETVSSQEESIGDTELQSGEQIDYFTQESSSEKGIGQSSSPAADYDTLIQSGKTLQNDGKLQEALDCFLQALDIKSGDPEVMLLTLNLYRQLAQK
uniref:DNA excision repair protein ERCC-6-like n=1 Tax=Cyanoderma ruficeps TaxID=181631 RepID=A0A8C3QPK8_9PASS